MTGPLLLACLSKHGNNEIDIGEEFGVSLRKLHIGIKREWKS